MAKNRKPSQKKLGTKIAVGFSLVALILIGTIAFTIIKIKEVDNITQLLYLQTTPQMASAMQIIKGVQSLMANERDWLLTSDPKYQTYRDNHWQKSIEPYLRKLVQNNPANISTSNINKIDFELKNLYQSMLKDDEAMQQSKEKRIEYFYKTIEPISEKISGMLEYFVAEKQSFLLAGLQSVKKQIIYVLIIDAGFLVLGLILCVMLGIVLTKLITKPVKQLVKMTEEIAKGDLEQRINLTEAEEFEHLSRSINHVVQTLNDIAEVNVKMSQGDYSHHVKVKSEQDKLAISTNLMLDNFNAIVNQANAIADGNYKSEINPRSEHDELGKALQHMTATLRKNQDYNDEQNWLKDGLAEFANIISDARNLTKLCNDGLSVVCRYVEAGMGAIYLQDKEENKLSLQGSFAFTERDHLANVYEFGQGLIGQVAYEGKAILLKSPEEKEHCIDTGLTKKAANLIYAMPLIYEKKLIGVLELAWLIEPPALTYQYLESLTPILSSHIQATQQQNMTEKLLQEQKLFGEKLSTQQEELKATNEELEHQAQVLKASEEELRIKDEEQRKANKQLEERTKELELQKTKIEETNSALKGAKIQLEAKAEELSQASKYKSEFLANMSHELRTPLNSLLILARLFADNTDKNLTEEQIESAKIMLKSGQDLLTLINDILDLAKVEAGKIDVHFSEMNLSQMTENLKSIFSVVAQDKGIEFVTEISDNVPQLIVSDEQRVSQIIRNLLSNALKFTSEGYVKLRIYIPQREEELKSESFDAEHFVAISVSDTGIGINAEKQKLVFESFQQADGTTSRKYGGTGLGLSISREFTKLLQGHIRVKSREGKGSTFTLYLPLSLEASTELVDAEVNSDVKALQSPFNTSKATEAAKFEPMKLASNPKATKQNLPGKLKKLLIIEDDVSFANTLMTLCRKKGYLCRHSITAEQGLEILEKDIPDVILLDINLPGMNGIELLEKLKQNKDTANVPVQIISASEEGSNLTKKGAIGYLTKPITQEQLDSSLDAIESYLQTNIKSLLIIEDNEMLLEQVKKLISKKQENLTIDVAMTGAEALDALKDKDYDCIILDLGLPDMSGLEVIQQYHSYNKIKNPSVIIYTGRELNDEDTQKLNQYADSIIIKGGDASIERLLQETSAFLEHTSPEQTALVSTSEYKTNEVQTQEIPKTKSATTQSPSDGSLASKRMLLVDDDARNLFAIKKILGVVSMNIETATDGKKALEILENDNSFDLVLMDIMMPVMDGYETMQVIRGKSNLKDLPIIALTAKALAGDKQKCLDSGANDYVTKPIDMDVLLTKVREWLTKK